MVNSTGVNGITQEEGKRAGGWDRKKKETRTRKQ